jgi:hypothetical protein
MQSVSALAYPPPLILVIIAHNPSYHLLYQLDPKNGSAPAQLETVRTIGRRGSSSQRREVS